MALPFPDIPPAIFTLPAIHLGGLALGPFSIRWYALAYIAGILLGWRYGVTLVRNTRLWGLRGAPITPPQVDDMILWITIGIIAGGRLGYVLFYMLPLASGRAELAADPVEVIRLWHGGMSFHGGTIGVILALFIFTRLRKIDLLSLADMVAACVPIGLGFGRLANFINGELWGRVTTSPLGMVFCGSHIAPNADGSCVAGPLPRYPSQLFEATLEGLVLFLVIRVATYRFGWFKRQGAVTGLFLLGYGLARTALENVRMPDEGLRNLPFGLTVGMMLSAPMILGGLFLLWRAFRRSPEPLPGDVSLKDRLIRDIREDGPMPVADYMVRCLHDPLDGYYATRPALGAAGDFITAPLVSQMFGEILGAWTHEVWSRLGSPAAFRLVELGPGTGVLMADMLRVARRDAAFTAACEPWLVERSAPLRALQAAAVPDASWADRLDEVPGGRSTILVGNEFLDCLPIHQAIARDGGWRERRVGVSDAGSLTFIEGPVWRDCPLPPPAHDDVIREWSPALLRFGAEVGARLIADGGAALFIDYGCDGPSEGDTLQSLRDHAREDPLENPGLADLTAHVDFPAFVATAARAGVAAAAIEAQGAFLRRLGIETRAAMLTRASPAKGEVIARQLDRLVSGAGMGELFKVAALASPGLETP